MTLPRQRDGEVDRDSGFADAALAGRDGDDRLHLRQQKRLLSALARVTTMALMAVTCRGGRRRRRLVRGQDGGRVGHAGLTHQHGLSLPPHRLHRRGMGTVGQQRRLHQAAAHLDPLHQAGGDDIPSGGRIFDRAQCGTQGIRRSIDHAYLTLILQTSTRRADKHPAACACPDRYGAL